MNSALKWNSKQYMECNHYGIDRWDESRVGLKLKEELNKQTDKQLKHFQRVMEISD